MSLLYFVLIEISAPETVAVEDQKDINFDSIPVKETEEYHLSEIGKETKNKHVLEAQIPVYQQNAVIFSYFNVALFSV